MTAPKATAATNHAAIVFPLAKIAKELEGCSPELLHLVRMACAGANGEKPCVGPRDQSMAIMRLNEAVTRWTREAKAARRSAND